MYPAEYWTEWPVYLTLNTSDPNPTIVWSTDSPDKIAFSPTGTTGANLISLAPSAPYEGFDIHIWVTVDGVASNQFPVLVNAPQNESNSGPYEATDNCAILTFGYLQYGYVGSVTYSVFDINGAAIIPIDTSETLENYTPSPSVNWEPSVAYTWPPSQWSTGNTYVDTYCSCWEPGGDANPEAVDWNTSGTTVVQTYTQKWWVGAQSSNFTGYCSERNKLTFYLDHSANSIVTSPVYNQDDCQIGQRCTN